MPLVKHHDTLSDLIKKGAEKKQGLHDERRRQSAYYAGWTIEELPESIAYCDNGEPLIDPAEKDPFLPYSALFLWIVEMKFIKYTRFVALIGAFIILTVDASTNPHEIEGLPSFVYPLDFIINIYYVLDGGLKLLSMYCYVAIARNCKQQLTITTYFRRSGIVDVPLSAISLAYSGDTCVNKWLHLARCMALSLFFLEQTPQIDVLMSGITAGLKSTLYTWSLMILIFLVYAATGVIFFRSNDPYHFGNLGMAMWTYFEMTTLDNWSDVLHINYHGCDVYDSDYYTPGTGFETVTTDYGTFYLPVCAAPSSQPLVSSALFTFFILMCGFVMVSLTVAFVTTGINNKLRTLKTEEDQLELLIEQGKAPSSKSVSDGMPLKRRKQSFVQSSYFRGRAGIARSLSKDKGPVPGTDGSGGFSSTHRFGSDDSNDQSVGGIKRANSGVSDGSCPIDHSFCSREKAKTSNKPTNNIIADPDLLRALLMQVWKAEEGGDGGILKDESLHPTNMKRRKGLLTDQRKVGNFNAKSFKQTMKHMKRKNVQRSDLQKWLMAVGVHMRNVNSNKWYTYAVSVLIAVAAVVQLLTVEERIDPFAANIIGILCQVAFTMDMMVKFLCCSPKYSIFLENSWNVFDLTLVFFLWIPILAVGASNLVYFELLKIMRILRLLKIFSWITEVNVIMKSISTSARCLAYVVFLMVVFFYHFGVAGVYLFSGNDPYHFGNIGKALLTLFQVSTMDDWAGIARMNMYGCLHIDYDPVYCDEEDSYGWGWLAAWYFIIFVIVGVMVLVALFVGVIITSMELLQLSIREEAEMLTKVAAKQLEFGVSDTAAHTLLEIFDMIDVCANGRLTLHELKPILGMVSLKESQQYELFHKIDEDMSGKIDFAEFVELIHLMNVAFTQQANSTTDGNKKSNSNLRKWLNPSRGEKDSMLSMLTNGFRPKKSLKSVVKMSILAQRLKKGAAESVKSENDDSSLSRESGGSDETKSIKFNTESSKTKWNAFMSRLGSFKNDASDELATVTKIPSSDPASDMSPNLQGQWFIGSSSVVPSGNSLDDVVAFSVTSAPPSTQVHSRATSGKATPNISRKYGGPLANSKHSEAEFSLERSCSDERFHNDNDDTPYVITSTLYGPDGQPCPKLATFNMDDISRSAPMGVADSGQPRPSTSGASSGVDTVPRAKFEKGHKHDSSYANNMSVDPDNSPGSSRGSSTRRRYRNSKILPRDETLQPNLFFGYDDSQKSSDTSSSCSPYKGNLEKMHL